MLTASLPFALLSLSIAPVMFIVDLVFLRSRHAKPSAPAARRSATSTLNCRKALPPSVKCRRSTAQMKTSNSSRKSMLRTVTPMCAPCPIPLLLLRRWKHYPMLRWPSSLALGGWASAQGTNPLRRDCHAWSGDHLSGICPTLQPADPTDRSLVDEYSKRHCGRGTHLQHS